MGRGSWPDSQPRTRLDLIKLVVNELGAIDILVNNAALQRTYADICDITAEERDETFRTNIFALFFLSKAAIPHMNPGSAIINTTPVAAAFSATARLNQASDL